MATWKFPLLLLGLSLLAVSATARPCKTLFFFTSTSYYPIPTLHSSNPNPNFYPSLSPRFLTFFFTTTPDDDTKFPHNKPSISFRPKAIFFVQEDQLAERGKEEEEEEDVLKRLSSMFPVDLYSSFKSSIRDRTKDIMGVMGAMVFGAGCGALTAAIMYLIWYLFWPTTFDYEDSDDDDDDANPKKMGYVVIPTKVVDDDLKKPAKEIV